MGGSSSAARQDEVGIFKVCSSQLLLLRRAMRCHVIAISYLDIFSLSRQSLC